MTHAQNTTQAETALLRNASGSATPVNNSCCAAARIIAPSSSTTEGFVPHEKLREAATPNAALTAQNRPPAQPAQGYTPRQGKRNSGTALNEKGMEVS